MVPLRYTSLFSRLAVVAVALFCFSSSAVRAQDVKPVGQLAFTIQVPEHKLALKQVHDIVLGASIGRGWIVKEDAPDRIVVYLNHRKNEATVTYLVNEATVTAYCEGWKTNGHGVRKGPAQPKGWLKYLENDILKGLHKAAYLPGPK